MLMKKLLMLILVVFIVCSITGCFGEANGALFDINSIKNYRYIPGVTGEEIAAIEALKLQGRSLSFGNIKSVEGFVLPDGSYGGFSPLICELLSELFEIPFVLEFYGWDSLMSGIDSGTIDLTSEFTITPERQSKYFMSNPIAQRSLGILTHGERKINKLQDLNGLRVGVLQSGAVSNLLANNYPELIFTTVLLPNIEAEIEMLRNGEIDVVVGISNGIGYEYAGAADLNFTNDMLPLAYSPIALSTANPEFEPVISVMNKYLAAGGLDKLHELYKSGDA
jgi:ABC-type amino acid transport substrate-binding protein